MNRSLWIGFTVLCSAVALLGQPNPQTRWTRLIYGDSLDAITSIVQAADGTYRIAGYTTSWGAGGWDMYVAALDSLGNQQWWRTYGGAYHDAALAMCHADGTNYIVAGYTQQLDTGPLSVRIIKISTIGVQQWTQTYSSTAEEYVNDIAPTSDGGYILTGESEVGGSRDIYLRKITSTGSPQWTHNVNHNDEEGYSARQTRDGGYIVAGKTTYSQVDGYLVKTNSNGIKTWDRFIGGPNDDEFRSVRQTADGGYIVAGESKSSGGYNRPYLVKTDSLGYARWTHVYGQVSHVGIFNTVEVLGDGNYVAAGILDDRMYIARIDTAGNVRWERQYTYNNSTTVDLAAYAMIPTRDDSYVLAGYVDSPLTNSWDIYAVKTGRDQMTINAAESPSGLVPSGYALSVYPNPFNAAASLEFTLPQAARARIEIYDVQGRNIGTAADDRFSPGQHRLSFDGFALPSGIYFARLTTADIALTQKMLLLK
jgi:hypothetical protein